MGYGLFEQMERLATNRTCCGTCKHFRRIGLNLDIPGVGECEKHGGLTRLTFPACAKGYEPREREV
jgi:hypothetical protein